MLHVSAERLSVTIGQKVVRAGIEEIWDSVLVLSDTSDGLLITRVLLCHPSWTEPQEVARVESDLRNINIEIAR